MTQAVRDTLIAVLRYAMGEGIQPETPSAEDCSELLRIAHQQSILPIVYDGLKRLGASAKALAPYEKARLKNGYYAIQRDDALLRIRAALDAAQVPYVLLKGAVIRQLYPDPDWRTSCDIDILVQEERLEEAIRVIEAQTAFHAKQRNYHDVSLANDHIHLELHFSLKENMGAMDPLLSRAWEYAMPTGDGSRYTFTPEYQIFHVVAHMAYHMAHGGLGIRPLLDLWLLRQKSVFDEANVSRMCTESGLHVFYEACVALIDAWFEDLPVGADLAVLEAHCLGGGAFGHKATASAARLREQHATGYLFRRLFPSREIMLGEFPGLNGRPWRLPWYTLKRWARLLNKHKRDSARQEFRALKDTQTETVADFDRLLTKLGL